MTRLQTSIENADMQCTLARHLDASVIEGVGRYLRAAGLGDAIDFERRMQFDRFEPWMCGASTQEGAAASLYETLHCGRASRSAYIPPPQLNALSECNLAQFSDGEMLPGRWRLSHFRNLFCASDVAPSRASQVYVGDDSLLFSRFLLSQPRMDRGLDIGSGSGLSTVALAQNCRDVVGIDVVAECSDAGYLTAGLNGVSSRCSFLASAVEEFTPQTRFDIVAANPPGVPVPAGITYSPAGNGGKDGTVNVLRFLEAGAEFCRGDGMLAMRFQSVGNDREIFAIRTIADLARARRWDVEFFTDILVPIEVRTALTVRNAQSLNPEIPKDTLLGRLDQEMKHLGATTYSSSSLRVRLGGSGQVTSQACHTGLSLDARIRNRRSVLTRSDIDSTLQKFIVAIGNMPGIYWRLADWTELTKMIREFETVCQSIVGAESPREALALVYPHSLSGPYVRPRALAIPFLAAVQSLCLTGAIKIEREIHAASH
ncbi:methyltransferase [Bradyrhizobium sp. CB82]|uniref:methyltransferase n=1 Tax=Bradyrhizobium sp. CB82 TaxID=3039159 RepID=UPI0024B14BCD|nr:methyltransferase [Bradyrhizobium sp. CB82]WFU42031.1 methyltransferase [Bradyrhizobium sp. CB82]